MSDLIEQPGPIRTPVSIRTISCDTRKRRGEDLFSWDVQPRAIPRGTQNATIACPGSYTGESVGVQYHYTPMLHIENGIIGVGMNFKASPEHPILKHVEAEVKFALLNKNGIPLASYEPGTTFPVEHNGVVFWNTNIPLDAIYAGRNPTFGSGDTNNNEAFLFQIAGRLDTITFVSQVTNENVTDRVLTKPTISHPTILPDLGALSGSDYVAGSKCETKLTLFPDQIAQQGEELGNEVEPVKLVYAGRGQTDMNGISAAVDFWVNAEE